MILSALLISLYPSDGIHHTFFPCPFVMIPASEQAIIVRVSFLSTTMAKTPRAWDATHRSTKTVTTDATVTFVALCWRESAYAFYIFSPWCICPFFLFFTESSLTVSLFRGVSTTVGGTLWPQARHSPHKVLQIHRRALVINQGGLVGFKVG